MLYKTISTVNTRYRRTFGSREMYAYDMHESVTWIVRYRHICQGPLEHCLGHRTKRKFGFRPVPNAEIIENRRLGHYRRSKSIICAVFLLLVELFVHPNLHQKHCFWWRFRLHQKLHQKHKFCLANRGVYRFVWFNLVQRRISRPIDRVRSGQVRSCQV